MSNEKDDLYFGSEKVVVQFEEDPDGPVYCTDHAVELVYAVDGWYCDQHATEQASAFLNDWFREVLAEHGGEVLEVRTVHDDENVE